MPRTTPEAAATRLRSARLASASSYTASTPSNVKPSNTFCSAHLFISRRHHVAIVVIVCAAARVRASSTFASTVDLMGNIGPGGL
ncbi:hypothetical protein BU23DRAFT_278980 [Bimuria novae-zelandiae CBS 107.79]|uniref:Uncharacterized protein n=1 Tax=Bimuria novae-zelandiae CBS 107.79 TaxID=1447943 RepID=A0A6A5UTM0_9PLEO|nr:hypothetical protein BU23DRAFT_278980 [Bimuria novae-zelandiae CBS 107.79]